MPDPITGALVVYANSDNETRLRLEQDDGATEIFVPIADHSATDRIVLEFGTTEVDSDVTPALFDLSQASYIGVKLGTPSLGLAKGRHRARVTTYDIVNPGGIVWEHDLPFLVR